MNQNERDELVNLIRSKLPSYTSGLVGVIEKMLRMMTDAQLRELAEKL